MKLDPGMHIGLHLVFFGKTGVTAGDLGRGERWFFLFFISFSFSTHTRQKQKKPK
jgi:hypothetical protein